MNKKTVVVLGTLTILILGLYVASPFVQKALVYPHDDTLSLFVIQNQDLNDHEVVVEVFDSHNKSLLKETYLLYPKTSVAHPRPFRFKIDRWSEYTFKVTLDDEITETYTTKTHLLSLVSIILDYGGDVNSINIECVFLE
ncbi:MAG: hypothetical protein JXA98_01385 [Methanosarcinaceae archaeon]|nr:hypothetical protein [Methanosarcinaceae archaeon]